MDDLASLNHYVERIEAAEAEKRAASDILRGVYAVAKAAGFDPSLLRQVVKERRMDAVYRDTQYELLNTYREALGLFADTPLGQAAIGNVTPMPRPFAEQPIRGRRGRPRKVTAREAAEELLGA